MQEAQIEAILQEAEIDLLVLARYMQIFSEDFCSRHAQHTINIHHSFLPAFEGAPKPVVSSCKDECVSPLCCSCNRSAHVTALAYLSLLHVEGGNNLKG